MPVGALPSDDGLPQVVSAPGGDVAVPSASRASFAPRTAASNAAIAVWSMSRSTGSTSESLELLSICRRAAVHGSQLPEQLPGVDLLRRAVAATGVGGQQQQGASATFDARLGLDDSVPAGRPHLSAVIAVDDGHAIVAHLQRDENIEPLEQIGVGIRRACLKRQLLLDRSRTRE
jgi:hypothetical protein